MDVDPGLQLETLPPSCGSREVALFGWRGGNDDGRGLGRLRLWVHVDSDLEAFQDAFVAGVLARRRDRHAGSLRRWYARRRGRRVRVHDDPRFVICKGVAKR